MFTGIVETVGRIQALEAADAAGRSVRLTLETSMKDLALGESVAVNGVCLTVAELAPGPGDATFFISQETLERTQLRSLGPGDSVNLERALRADGRLSGHLVQGHVDGLATLESLRPVGEATEAAFLLPRSLSRYCVEKGSIALSGVSLTINAVEDLGEQSRIRIMLIPHTVQNTIFREARAGERFNVEVDVLAKYVERLACRN